MKLDDQKLKRVSEVLQVEIDTGRLPGAVVSVGVGEAVLYEASFGYAEKAPGVVRRMSNETIFDLASLTKVTATLPAVLALIEDGEIRLNDPVATFIPEFSHKSPQQPESTVTLHHLLTHSAGLPAHRQYYLEFANAEDILAAVRRQPLAYHPGSRVVYSDIGFILLGEIVREVTGQKLNEFARERVFEPLGMKWTSFCPPQELYGRIAATAEQPVSGVTVGTVHDENSAALHGVSGHAGLFAPLSDLVKYQQMWLGYGPSVLSPWMRQKAVQLHTAGLNGKRGLGWVRRMDDYDHTGDLWPETTVGHTGFTGTSLAFDPATKLWMIILTNDVHYGREQRRMIRLRGLLHNLVGACVVD